MMSDGWSWVVVVRAEESEDATRPCLLSGSPAWCGCAPGDDVPGDALAAAVGADPAALLAQLGVTFATESLNGAPVPVPAKPAAKAPPKRRRAAQ